MKNQLIVAACAVATCFSSIAFAAVSDKPHQGTQPKASVKTGKAMSTTTVTKHTKHTKKS